MKNKNLIMDSLKNFKKSTAYKYFMLYIFKPLYDLFWQYIINFQGKVLYFLWFSKKRKLISLEKNDKKLISDNSEFKKLAKKIDNYCSTNVIGNSRSELLSGEIIQGNPTNSI